MSKYALVDNTQVIHYIIAGYIPGSSYSPPSGLNLYLVDDAAIIGDGWDNENQIFTPLEDPLVLTPEQRADANIVALQVAVIGALYLLGGKAATSHGHVIADVTGLQAALDAKQGGITAAAHIAAPTGGAATNAATNAPTNLTGLLAVISSSELNSTNTKQNDLAAKYNDLAGRHNALCTIVATLLSHLEAQALQAAS